MRFAFKFLLVLMALAVLHTAFAYHPVILASLDGEKYVDGEVFRPVDGEYDFRKFTLKSSQTENYTTIIDKSGFAQFLDGRGNHTINVLEWDKMTSESRDRLNSSFMIEVNKPSYVVDGVRIVNTSVLDAKFYGSCVDFPNSNAQIYVATPTVNETVEMVRTLKFRDIT